MLAWHKRLFHRHNWETTKVLGEGEAEVGNMFGSHYANVRVMEQLCKECPKAGDAVHLRRFVARTSMGRQTTLDPDYVKAELGEI